MRARATRIGAPERVFLSESAERVARLYEVWDEPEQAARWKAKLGRAELPADVFAPASER
jgi:hypothetical protein